MNARGGGGNIISDKFFNQDDNAHNDNKKGSKKDEQTTTIVISRRWAKILYYLSAMNPLIAVLFNDYSKMLEPIPILQTQPKNVISQAVTGFVSIVRLKPRISFTVGAMLRALQLNTAIENVIDPTIGIGFGLNVLCLFAKTRWPSTIILGWSITKTFWKILGSKQPNTGPIPITMALPFK